MAKAPKTLEEAEHRLFRAEAEHKFALVRVGDRIAKDKKYRHLTGLEAIYRYLIDKYHWTPSVVRTLTLDDLDMLLGDLPRPAVI